jgi:hypothetical protein
MKDGLFAHRITITSELLSVRLHLRAFDGPGKPDRSNRFGGGASARPGNSGHGQSNFHTRAFSRSSSHVAGDFPTDRTEFQQPLFGNAQEIGLGGIAVGNESPVKPFRTTDSIGTTFADPPAGAGFGTSQPPPLCLQRMRKLAYAHFYFFIHQIHM